MLSEHLRRSLFAKIVLAALALLSVLLTANLLIDYRVARQTLVKENVRQGTDIANTLAFIAEAALAGDHRLGETPSAMLQRMVHRISRRTDVRDLAVINGVGGLLAGVEPGAASRARDEASILRAIKTAKVVATPVEREAVVFFAPVRLTHGPDGRRPAAVLVFNLDLRQSIRDLRARMARRAIFALASSLAVAGMLIGLGYAFVLRPTQRLAQQAERLGKGDLGARSGLRADPRGDEIERLAHAFDAMAADIERDRVALARQEERLALALEAVDEAYWDWDLQHDRGFHSHGLPVLMGYPPSDSEGTVADWLAVTHPDDHAAIQRLWSDHIEGRRPRFEVEYRMRTRDGDWRWFLSRGRVVQRDAAGGPLRATGTVRDITDRKEAEAALRTTERRLELTLQAIEEGYWDWDLVRDSAYNSPRVTRMLGYEPEEMGSSWRDWSNLIHPEDARRVLAAWRAHYRNDTDHYEAEYRMRTKQGDWLWVYSRGKIVERASDGTPTRATGSNQNIDRRKRTEEALRESEERLGLAFDAIEEGYWDWDMARDTTYFSPRLAQMLGYATEEIPDHPIRWLELVHPEDAEAARRAWGAHLRGEATHYEAVYRMRAKTGEWRWVRSRGKIVARDERGRALRATGANREITAEVEAEEERRDVATRLVQAEKLESLAVLAGGVAHDFNNLLVSILGNASLAAAELPEGSDARAAIDRVETATERAGELANQMLAYSGRGKFVTMPIDLPALVAEMAELLRAAVPNHIELAIEDDGATPVVEGDPTQLRQIVMNLLTNASEAIGSVPGRVQLRTGRVVLEEGECADTFTGAPIAPGMYAYAEVRDTGSGMDAETLERICDPFFSTKKAGRGLGLAGVQGIVRGHGGAMIARSAPGKGTMIRVLLSRGEKRVAAPGRADPAIAEPRVPPGCVLVVDDEEPIRVVTRRILEANGYKVFLAEDGEEAMAVFRAHEDEIALVILDLTMPLKGGDAVFAELHEYRPGTPVIVTSGYAEHEVTARFGTRPPADVIQKPFTGSELVRRVREVLGVVGVET
ncbi:MAG: PAS domain-containing protein [Myxococcales bacterium]|nr:PAS domain-containing protein [Myxococcales bacterium]